MKTVMIVCIVINVLMFTDNYRKRRLGGCAINVVAFGFCLASLIL